MIDDSFDEFVRGQIASLTRYAIALTGNRHAAEDLVQETLIKVMGAWKRIRADGNPAGYATTVMFRTHVSIWRRSPKPQQQLELTVDPRTESDAYADVDARLALDRRLQELPKLQRAVLVASFLDDHGDAEIAQMIGRSAATVRSLRHRALKTLRAGLTGSTEHLDSNIITGVTDGNSRIAAA